MKKLFVLLIVVAVLVVVFMGGALFTFSSRNYAESVSENIEQLPDAPNFDVKPDDGFFDVIGNFFGFLWNCLTYPFKLLDCFVSNLDVLFGLSGGD